MKTRISAAKMFCTKRMKYRTLSWLFRTVGKMSEGIRLGWKYGFDSGESLDYVYQNQARGIGPLGKFMDRCYLNSAGWSGIRTRGKLLKETIVWAVNKCEGESTVPIELIDIASGPGRYILDLLSSASGINSQRTFNARMYDVDEIGLEQGRERARQLGVRNVQFLYRDAFVPGSQKGLDQADIAVASGLYELFSNNDLVSKSLDATSNLLRDGGYLIYTNQPWHPDLEFISEVLTNRNGEAWSMRCRSQPEMDELVRSAGFKKLTTRLDEKGIFSVSIAIKAKNKLAEPNATVNEWAEIRACS